MLANFVRGIFPSDSSQSFEKARIQATQDGNTNPPQEKDLTTILLTLADKNPELRGTAAFYLTLANMQANKATKSWIYVLKNFILFDKAIDERCFAKEISELEIDKLIVLKGVSGKLGGKLDIFLKRYFRYIRAKGRVHSAKHFQFNHSYEQKKRNFELLASEKLFLESKKLKSLVVFAFDVFETTNQDLLQYKLIQYIITLIASAIVKVLSLHYLLFVVLIDNLSALETNKIHELYESFKMFLNDRDLLISYYNTLKNIPGLQIPQGQIFDPQLTRGKFKLIDDYRSLLLQHKSETTSKLKTICLEADFSPKAPEITLPPLTEISVPQHKGDDNVMESSLDLKHFDEKEQPFGSVFLTNERTYASPVKYKSARVKSPKTITKAFKDTFFTSFSKMIDKGELDIKVLKEQEKMKGRIIVNEANGCTSGLLGDLLSLAEPDELFENYTNLYSSDVSNKPSETPAYTSNKYDRELNKLITRAYISRKEEESKDVGWELFKIKDFDQDLFDSFTNNYSNS